MKFSSRYSDVISNFIFNKWGLSNVSNRNKFVKKWLTSINHNETILDAGAGTQQYKKFASHLKYTSQDFGIYEGGDSFGETYHRSFNTKNCDIICDITNIPREDCSFENIMCTEVFEHLPNPMAALKEFNRLLKKT